MRDYSYKKKRNVTVGVWKRFEEFGGWRGGVGVGDGPGSEL